MHRLELSKNIVKVSSKKCSNTSLLPNNDGCACFKVGKKR